MITLSRNFSPGVDAENVAWERFADATEEMSSISSPEEYVVRGGSLAPPQYESLLGLLASAPLDILDVGVGKGQSSVFLASKGHRVWAVEPNQRFCAILERKATEFSLPVKVCLGVGEDLDKLQGTLFDAVFFNASLHHCDDIARALANAHALLKPGGKIFLVNENFLRPWRSKAWFQRRLIEDPVGMGHYGGNEHAYHNWEYLAMLRQAGFAGATTVAPRMDSPVAKLEFILLKRLDGRRIYSSSLTVLSRFLYYIVEDRLAGNRLLSRLSILSCHFVARKPLMHVAAG